MMRARASQQGGFTLIELSIALTVVAVLAAAILPDAIEQAKLRVARKAAEDVVRIQEAAQWFFVQSSVAKGDDRWPGEQVASRCPATPASDPFDELVTAGYLVDPPVNELNAPGGNTKSGDRWNPWQERYVIDFRMRPLGGADPFVDCYLRVGTRVPEEMAQAFIRFLPNATCHFDAPPTEDRRIWCSSSVRRPGFELP
jgi:prepilin-type N-terminal cleavage/methylation domain-containing protein